MKQTMQQWLLQCGSRLCHCCVLELHNATLWVRKWHIPYNTHTLQPTQRLCGSKLLPNLVNLHSNIKKIKTHNNIILRTLDESKDCESARVASVFLCVALHQKDRRPAGQGLGIEKGWSDRNPGLTFCSLQITNTLLMRGVDLYIVLSCFSI